MAYNNDEMEEEGQSEEQSKEQRNKNNNIKNVRNAADIAVASGHPVASGIGKGIQIGDKLTGGKVSEKLGERLAKASKFSPGGNKFQDISNKLSESGLSDKAGAVARAKNGQIGKPNGNAGATNPTNTNTTGGNTSTSSQSSSSTSTQKNSSSSNNSGAGNKDGSTSQKNNQNNLDSNKSSEKSKDKSLVNSAEDKKEDDSSDSEEQEAKGNGLVELFKKRKIIIALLLIPIILFFALFIFFTVSSIVESVIGNFVDAFQVTSDDDTGVYAEVDDDDLSQFLDDVKMIYNGTFISNNIMVCKPEYVVAVYHIIYEYDPEIYEKISTNDIKEVFWASLQGDFYNEETFRNNLISDILPKYLQGPDYDYEEIADDIFEYVDDFYDLIGNDEEEITCEVDVYTCDYKKGNGYYVPKKGYFSSEKNNDKGINISNLYVQLMKCNSTSEKLPDEKLISFEKYILGVTYAVMDEDAPFEAVKAQAVIVRDYAIRRYLEQLNGNSSDSKILKIDSCDGNNKHPYCDADLGCTYDYDGNYRTGVVIDENRIYKEPLPADSVFRRAVKAVNGVTLMTAENYILSPDYSNKDTKNFISLANKGNKYNSILLSYYSQYGANNLVENECTSVIRTTDCVSDGKYVEWKQKDPEWKDIPIGKSGSTLGQIGCLVTSISMQIAKSGVKTRINNFNPGTFVQFLNNNNGFDNYGNFQWSAATVAAPSFKYVGQISLSGMSEAQKFSKIKELTSQPGVYVVAEVLGGRGQHWVAIDSVKGNKIKIMDPGKANGTGDLWTDYKWPETSTLAYYRVDRSSYAR